MAFLKAATAMTLGVYTSRSFINCIGITNCPFSGHGYGDVTYLNFGK